MNNRKTELTDAELWHACDPALFDFATTESLPGEVIIIGQERAVQALGFGVGIPGFGYNIFALGDTGTGRATTVHTFLNRLAAGQRVPDDWVYVNNFLDSARPVAIRLPPGLAVQFRRDMQELVEDLKRELPRVFESEAYEQQKQKIVHDAQEGQNAVLSGLEELAATQGFALLRTATGFGLAPLLNGQVLSPEGFEQLDRETQKNFETQHEHLQGRMAEAMRRIRELDKNLKAQLRDFDREVASTTVKGLMEELYHKYGYLEEVPDYLAAVQADVVDNLDRLKGSEEAAEGGESGEAAGGPALARRYAVNVVVDHSRQQGAPVIFEPNPTYENLLGAIQHRAEFGALLTDFTMIRAGALHRANGGYLIVEARPLVSNAVAWEGLKRALKNRQVRIEELSDQFPAVSTVAPQPEPVPLDVKVVLLGDPETYYVLYDLDEDFRKQFKVKAEFSTEFERTDETMRCYAQFIAVRCHQEGLLHFTPDAVARVVEHGSRLAEHQQKLSTRFSEIADLVRESSYWARRRGQDRAQRADVEKAIEEKVVRSNRAEGKIQELIREGTLRVHVEGQAVGQVNGLSVLSLGDYAFGRPSRITARTYTGKAGVISLDREARLSGRIYDKGVLTLSGYLGGQYAVHSPLSLSATISFEQLYEEVDGDSASSAELYALLSSLSGLPVKQGLAVTGAVDQQGNVQPVGGINEKVEGFFETCCQLGLTGEQGVLVPAQNVVNLMLSHRVRQAVADGRFHVYPVRTVDEGLELLTGFPAGELQPDGSYPPESVHGRVVARLNEIADNLREPEEEEEEGEA